MWPKCHYWSHLTSTATVKALCHRPHWHLDQVFFKFGFRYQSRSFSVVAILVYYRFFVTDFGVFLLQTLGNNYFEFFSNLKVLRKSHELSSRFHPTLRSWILKNGWKTPHLKTLTNSAQKQHICYITYRRWLDPCWPRLTYFVCYSIFNSFIFLKPITFTK